MPSSEVIEFECPRCLKNLRVENDQAGKRIDCPSCQGSLLVPNQSVTQDLFDDLFDSPSSDLNAPTQKKPKPEQANNPTNASAEEDPLADLEFVIEGGNETGLEPIDESAEPEAPLLELVEESDDPLADLVVPGDESAEPIKSIKEMEANDPFQVDPDAPIKVEGVGEIFSHDDVFGIKCRICDTRIHVRLEQVGTEVKCPVCYSPVAVKAPKKKKAQDWDKKGKGRFTSESSGSGDGELKLSDPIERPKVDIDESFGLEPVEDDLLSPKTKVTPSQGYESLERELAEDPPLLEVIEDDDELVHPTNASLPRSTNRPKRRPKAKSENPPASNENRESASPKKKRRVKSGSNSRREAFEAAQRRQEQADQASSFNRAIDSSGNRDFPDHTVADLFSSAMAMVKTPGILSRVLIAAVIMCVGAITMESFVPFGAEPNPDSTMGQRLTAWACWGALGGIPYLIGVAVLWSTCSFIFRDAALGKQAVANFKTNGANELLSTLLVFGFGFFIGGLPALFFTLIILPLRFCVGPLFMIGAWHNQSPFGIVSVDAFKTITKTTGLWKTFYVCMGILSVLGLMCGLLFWMRAVGPFMLDAVVLVIGILLSTGLTLLFAPICGWHCGRVMESLEKSD